VELLDTLLVRTRCDRQRAAATPVRNRVVISRSALLSLLLLGACSRPEPVPEPVPETAASPIEARPTDQATPTPSFEITTPPVDDPGVPTVDARLLLDAPPRYTNVLIRAALPIGRRYANLIYEGNNKNFRGPASETDLYRSGDETAADWRLYAAGVRKLVVLRDSLFSQQDHPISQTPRALMMPPNWVSVAVAEVLAGRTPIAPRSAPIDDDAGWASADATALFGSFPASERLFLDATRPLANASPDDASKTRNARRSMQSLAAAAQAMIDAAPHGPEAVAQTGAEWIAASDRSYFGVELRRSKIIPIFVENPNEHEARDEGKGLGVWGRELPEQALALTRKYVYARRLADGDLALERYDLRHASEQARAIALLETLIPPGSSGHDVWLWVNGGSDGHGSGDPAVPYIPDFQVQLEAAQIELSRLVLLSKPSIQPWGDDAKQVFEAEVDRHAALATQPGSPGVKSIPLSAQLSTAQLERLIAQR
jgi:hypothetical protein